MSVTNEVTLAATDGHRIAEARLDNLQAGNPLSAIVPGKALIELASVLSIHQGTLRLFTTPARNRIKFQSGPDYLESALMEGTYPPYENALPSGNPTTLIVDRQQLVLALRRCEVIAQAGHNAVTLTAEERSLKLTGESVELGRNVERIDAVVKGSSVSVSISGPYLVEGAAALNDTKLVLELRGKRSPVILRPMGRSRSWYLLSPRVFTEGPQTSGP
jgi:DNA polymerase-3 subunit beta